MESFINDILNADFDGVYDGVTTAEEVLLNRRISPYATLRPGDLAALLKHQQSHLVHHPAAHHPVHRCGSVVSEELDLDEDVDGKQESKPTEDLVVRGADEGHVPAVYEVKSVGQHEMPVIGVCVDSRIVAGFTYRVRKISPTKADDFLWNGKSRTLQSIGMGYGRRLTFKDDTLNNNECYFWSDSEPMGYAFNIHVVDEGQTFLIQDDSGAVLGEAQVEAIHEPQEEISSTAIKGDVTKQVKVAMTCCVTYYHKYHHGLVDLMASEEFEIVTGYVVMKKSKRQREATLEAVQGVFLPRLGDVKFVPDNC